MADNILKGIVSIEVQGVQELSALQKQVSSFGNGVKASVPPAADAFKKLASPINDAVVSFKKIPPVVGQAGNSFTSIPSATNQASTALRRVPQAANQATFAMTNLSRVVQDAPYGFIGIANNLNPLLESFQRLKVETGSTGGAMKALGSSLLGPGGIGLALGVITTALTFVTTGFGAWTRGLTGAKSATEQLEEKMKTFNAELEKNKEGIDQVASSYERFIRVASLNARFRGFGDIDILKGEAGTFAETVLGPLREAERRNFDATGKLQDDFYGGSIKSTEEFNKKYDALIEERKGLQNKIVEAEYNLKGIQGQIRLEQQKADRDAFEKSKADYEAYVNDIISRGKELANYFKDVAIVPTFGIFDTKSDQFKKALGFINDIDAGQVKLKLTPVIDIQEPAVFAADSFGEYFSTELGNYFKKPVSTDFSLLTALLPKAKTDAEKLADTFGSILSAGFQDSFSSLGEGLGNALSGKDFGAGLTQALGGLLSSLGKALIQYGAIKEGLDKIFGAGGFAIPGAVAIGLGVLAIAAGKAISNFGGGRAVGGAVKAGTGYLVGENGPEYFQPGTSGSIIPNGRLSTMSGGGFAGRVVFEISGNKLIGVLANGNRSQGALI